MDALERASEFDELREMGKKIDEGIHYLEKKLTCVTDVGLSIDPAKTKIEAEEVLKEYDDEIEEIRKNLDSYLLVEEDMVKDCIENNEKVSNFIHQLRNDLDDLENELAASDETYQRYQPAIVDENLNNITTEMEKPEETGNHTGLSVTLEQQYAEEMDTTVQNGNKSNVVYTPASFSYSVDNIDTPVGSRFFVTPLRVIPDVSRNGLSNSKECSRYLEKSVEKSVINTSHNSSHLFSKKSNTDVCKTPVDPGISVTCMKLLAKSNVKTKVYKTEISNFSQIKAEN